MEKSRENAIDLVKKTQQTGISERLSRALELLGFKNALDFSKLYSIKRSTLYAVLNNQTKNPNSKFLESCRNAGINISWLISGDGEPLLKQAPAGSEGIRELRTPLESEAGGEPVVKVEPFQRQEPSPGFEQRREIGALLVKLDLDNLFHVRRMIDALIAASQKK